VYEIDDDDDEEEGLDDAAASEPRSNNHTHENSNQPGVQSINSIRAYLIVFRCGSEPAVAIVYVSLSHLVFIPLLYTPKYTTQSNK